MLGVMGKAAVGASPHPVDESGEQAYPRVTVVDLLTHVARDLQLRVKDGLAAAGEHGLRPSFAPLLQLIWEEGLPVGRVAEELRVSAQAVSRSATFLEGFGYLERTPNAADGRSRLLVLTEPGRRLIEQGAQAIVQSESDYAAYVGKAALDQLLRDLAVLRTGLGLTRGDDPLPPSGSPHSLGVIIVLAVQAHAEILEAISARGHTEIRSSHQALLTLLGTTGERASELARRQQVSRQAISSTVQELESFGYIERRPDEHDRRSVILTLTSRGNDLLETAALSSNVIEARHRQVLGAPRFTRFSDTLRRLDEAVHRPALPSGGQPLPPIFSPARNARGAIESGELGEFARQIRARLSTQERARLVALLADPPPADTRARHSRVPDHPS
jgi:DNA-binding MarR family transcriptional regulator